MLRDLSFFSAPSAVDFSRFPFTLLASRFTLFSAPSAPLRWIFRFFPSRLSSHASRFSPRSLRLCGGFFAFSLHASRLTLHAFLCALCASAVDFSLFPFTLLASRLTLFLRALCASAVDFSLFPFPLLASRFTLFSAPSAPLRWIFRSFPSRLSPHASRFSLRPLRLCGGFFAFSLHASPFTPLVSCLSSLVASLRWICPD